MVGCETSDDSSSSQSAVMTKGPTSIVYLNNNRTELVMADGWTLKVTPSTKVDRQRPSCSGFEAASTYDLAMSDSIEYKIDMKAPTTDVPNKTAYAIEIDAWRAECLHDTNTPSIVYYTDTDRDGVADFADPDPNDPNVR